MAHGDAREGKWRGNSRKQWVASALHTTSEHAVSSITTADARTLAASSPLNWRPPADLNGLVRLAAKTKCVFSKRLPSHFKRSLLTHRFLYALAGWSSGYCLVTAWLLPGYWLVTSWLLPSYFLVTSWLLLGYCLVSSWLLPVCCLVTDGLLPSYCLVTSWLLPGYCLVTSLLLPGYYLVTSWLLPGRPFRRKTKSFFLRVCRHISTDLYCFTQCSSARLYKLLFCQLLSKSWPLREPKVRHSIHNSSHIYENVIWYLETRSPCVPFGGLPMRR